MFSGCRTVYSIVSSTNKKFPLSCYKWNIQKMIVYNDCNKRQKREKIKNQQNEKNVYVVLGRENGGANEITTKKGTCCDKTPTDP